MEEIEKFIKLAKEKGIKKDQLENFLSAAYIPFPWQLEFHSLARQIDDRNNPITEIGLGGARGPGKTYSILAQIALDDSQRIKGLKSLFLRQIGAAAAESFEDVINKLLAGKIDYKYNKNKNILQFPNGSKIVLGGFKDSRDIDKYIGIEYDLMALEELTQLTEEKVLQLKGSLRTSKENWKPRIYCSFNPGGIGMQWVKRKFILKEDKNCFFIPATYKDNPFLNKEYIEYLESLPGSLGKAWREGDWDILEGQFFNEWRVEKHVCEPFPIPVSWPRFRGYDHGRENPACCLWFTLDYNGRVYCYRELYVQGWNADQIAREINRLSEGESYVYSVADPSIFAKMGHGETIAEVFARNGIAFIPASNRRIDGWNTVHQYLYWDESTLPKIMFFKTCLNTIRTIPMLIHDEKKPEDLDTRGEDHCADALRYFLQTLRERKGPKPLTEVERKLLAMKRESLAEKLDKLYQGDYYNPQEEL